MSVIRANVPELLTVDLDHVLFETLGTFQYEQLLNEIYSVQSSEKQLEYGLTVGGF